ncbi:MAG: DUF1080 domain-containing protein [Lentisphaeraceae bacterium]|nr:DUF1080 domain-containing protein [Lentisphaeraceae bacterium]
MKTLLIALLALISALHSQTSILLDNNNQTGWKQAGPGNFSIKHGIATSEGGMGLLWYTKKSFKNVTFSLQFKMENINHNSGIFVLFPECDNDPQVAIKHGYEIQINRDKASEYTTGAIYGLKAPSHIPLRKGEWNNYKITCLDGYIIIQLNGELINIFKGNKGLEGHIGLQNHDKKSKVQFRNIIAVEHSSLENVFSPIERVMIRKYLNPKERWHNLVDLGASITGTVKINQNDTYAYKGLTVYTGHELDPYSITYDTDLLRVASINHSKVNLIGTLYDGTHNSSLQQDKDFMVTSKALPGWTHNGSFEDKRVIPHGPIKRTQAHFKGIYKHNSRVTINFTVGDSEVLESPKVEGTPKNRVFTRTINIGPRKTDIKMAIGDFVKPLSFSHGKTVFKTNPSEEKDIVTTAIIGGDLNFQESQDRVFIQIPAGDSPLAFKVISTEGDKPQILKTSIQEIEDLSKLIKLGKAQYPQKIKSIGHISKNNAPYAVDNIPVPFKNPWLASMRLGAFDFFKDGETAAMSTWNGDVWLIKNITHDLKTVTWKRICAGLYEPLGLKIVNEVIYVNCRDMVARLHDLNNDEEIDYIENFNNEVMTTANHHEYSFDLKTDKKGNFYFAKAAPVDKGGRGFQKVTPHNGTVLKLSKDGSKLEVYSTGMRASNGIGVSPDGQLTAGDNEGTWVPHCKLHWLKPGSFQGVKPVAHKNQNTKTYNKPLCWFPMEVDNSSGDQVWVTNDKWGPFTNDLIHLSYGTSSIYKVMKDEVDGQVQGGVFKIPVKLASSAMRSRFNPKDNQLYICGLKGWQTNAAFEAAFQRVRYTGKRVHMPKNLRVGAKGIFIEFTTPLDKELAEDTSSYSIQCWNYLWGPQYGSGEFSALKPDKKALKSGLIKESKNHRQRDSIKVKKASLLKDEKTVYLEFDVQEVMQMQIKVDVESKDGDAIIYDIYNTINRVPK